MSEQGHDRPDRHVADTDPPAHPHVAEAVERVDALAEAAVVKAEEVADQVVEPTARFRWKRGDTARVVIAALALLACWVSALAGVSDIEAAVFRAVNGAPGWLYPVVWPPMQLGNVTVVVVLAIVVGIVAGKPRIGFLAALAAVVAWIVAKVVKEQVRRGRPETEGIETTLRGQPEDGFGFISGHATVAFAVASVVAPHLRRPWNWVALGLAVVVGLARLFVGVHLPLDVVGGAACGLLIGEVVRLVEVLTRRRTRAKAGATPG
jgi:undecaprenyl-diphosphatase